MSGTTPGRVVPVYEFGIEARRQTLKMDAGFNPLPLKGFPKDNCPQEDDHE